MNASSSALRRIISLDLTENLFWYRTSLIIRNHVQDLILNWGKPYDLDRNIFNDRISDYWVELISTFNSID